MGFLLACPNCGKRNVSEFTYGGEFQQRPLTEDAFDVWSDYVYMRQNASGEQVEWWYHRSGCKRWFLCRRDTTNNSAQKSFWLDGDRQQHLGG